MSAPPLFRLVDERRVSVVRDAAAVRQVLQEDPVGSCMVASRVAEHGIEPSAIGGELWTRRRASESLCYAGANLIPLRGDLTDLNAFADKAMSTARRCSSLVGRAECVMPMWRRLEHAWGPARDVRDHQPLMALSTAPQSPVDPAVRPVRVDELDAYLVAAIDMFIGEVGIDPRIGDGGRGYRRRVAGLIAAGRAWARFDAGNAIRGSLTDLTRLAELVGAKLATAEPGAPIHIREEYAPDSRYSLLLDVRADGFDPSSPEHLGTFKVNAPANKPNA